MREIKFQVWDSERKQMYHMSQNRFSFGLFEGHRAVSWEDVFAEKHDELIPLQYTGLKDRNGKEIYEGDILQDPTGVGEVEWVQEHCAFVVFAKNPNKYHSLESDGTLLYSEVIGNIYETPELLHEP